MRLTRSEVALASALLMALIGLLLPAVQKAREAAAQAACRLNLGRLAAAAHAFHVSQAGFPAGEKLAGPRGGEYYACWVSPLLPYLGEGERAKAIAAAGRFPAPHQGGRRSLYGTPIPGLICPSDALPPGGAFEYCSPDPASPTYDPRFPEGRYDAACSYGANWGTQTFLPTEAGDKNGVFHYDTRTRVADVTDGTAYTVLFGERSHREPRWRFMGYPRPAQQDFAVYSRWWTGGCFTGRQPHAAINHRLPGWIESDPPANGSPAWTRLYHERLGSYGSEHPDGCNLAMVDGSVRFVSDRLDLTTLRALSTRAGAERLVAD